MDEASNSLDKIEEVEETPSGELPTKEDEESPKTSNNNNDEETKDEEGEEVPLQEAVVGAVKDFFGFGDDGEVDSEEEELDQTFVGGVKAILGLGQDQEEADEEASKNEEPENDEPKEDSTGSNAGFSMFNIKKMIGLGEDNEENGTPEKRSQDQTSKESEGSKTSVKEEDVAKKRELAELENLTPAQLKQLQKDNEAQIEGCKNKIAALRADIDSYENEQCITARIQDENSNLKEKQREILIEEKCLDELKKRSATIQEVKPKYRPFPVDQLPKVIICSQWRSGIPKIAVAGGRSKQEPAGQGKLHQDFGQLLTPRQIEEIEDEQRWMNVTLGQLEMQIAGLKGKVRVTSHENDVLKAIIEQPPNKNFSIIEPYGKPCQGLKGKPGKSVPCGQMIKAKKEAEKPRPLVITVSSTEITEPYDPELEELRTSLTNARDTADTLKAQQDALRCLKRSIKDSCGCRSSE